MIVEHTSCYILHRRDYLESSFILEIFSREHGRFSLIAKGAKRNKKKQGVSYDLYQEYLMTWVSKTDLGVLIDAELATIMTPMSPVEMMTGFYINEIILRLLHKHESHPELFDTYNTTVKELSNSNTDQSLIRYFEKNLLQSLGYGLIFAPDLHTGSEIAAENDYHYKLDLGPTSNSNDSRAGIPVSGKTLIDLNNETLIHTKNKKEAKILLRSLLNQYLGEKPLASRKLYQEYIKQKQFV
jgi:DNA repair protein RecO (recombination protein O)